MSSQQDLSKEKVDVLKRMCKEKGLSGYSKLKKSELISLLNSNSTASQTVHTLPLQSNIAQPNTEPSDGGLRVADEQQSGHPPPSSPATSSSRPSSANPGSVSDKYPESQDTAISSHYRRSSISLKPLSGYGSTPDDEVAEPFKGVSRPTSSFDAPAPITGTSSNMTSAPETHLDRAPIRLSADELASSYSSVAGSSIGLLDFPAKESSPSNPQSPLYSAKILPVESQRRRLIGDSSEYDGPVAKRQKILSKGKIKAIDAAQAAVDSQLMPPPTFIPTAGGHHDLASGNSFISTATLKASYTSQKISYSPTSTSLYNEHRTRGQSQSQKTNASTEIHSTLPLLLRTSSPKLKQLVYKEPGRREVANPSPTSGKDSSNISVDLTALSSMVRLEESKDMRQLYNISFLCRFFTSTPMAFSPLADPLWSSPDHPLQATVALRFVLSRLFVALGCGMLRQWSANQVVDARPIGKTEEVWAITVQDENIRSSSRSTFYILSATGEVIGRPPESMPSGNMELPLRADWSAFVDLQSSAHLVQETPVPNLFSLVKWQNAEEYDHGISKAWLQRLRGDPEASAKLTVAQRYILANVVPNSVSGRYMTPLQMAQNLNGSDDAQDQIPKQSRLGLKQNVNMFVAVSNYVESVHFQAKRLSHPITISDFHSAVASIQTPAREVYILRDTGQEIGTEEDGICTTWTDLLGCDARGFC